MTLPWIPIGCEKLDEPIVGFWVLMLLFIIFGWFSGLGEGTVYVMAGSMPTKYMGAIILGRGISGFFSNLLSIVSINKFDISQNDAAITFFSISAAGSLLASTFYVLVLKRNECFKFYIQDSQQAISMARSGRFVENTAVTES